MANWSNPLLTSTYTNFVTEVKDRDTDLALQFDGTTSTNIPTNTIRWNSSANRWQKWNGSSWAELTSTYALTGLSTTGSAAIGGTVSGTALVPTANTAPTNGVYLPNANTVGIATNSAGRVFVDASGRFGVGTSTPGTAIDVTAAAGSATAGNIRIAPSTAGQARFHLFNGGATAEWIFGQKTSTDHDFKLSKSVAGSESDYLTVTTTGSVGIGTNNPQATLDVSAKFRVDTTSAFGVLSLARPDGTHSPFIRGADSVGTASALRLGDVGGSQAAMDISAAGNIIFYTNTATTERLRIDSSGQLIIAAKGNGVTNGAIYNVPYTGGQANAVSQVLQVATGTANALARITLSTTDLSSNNSSFITFSTSSGGSGSPAGDLTAERLRIDSSGRVGIGTTSPSTSLEIQLAAANATSGNVYVVPPTAGQARYRLYNTGGTAEWIFGQKTGTDHDFKLSKLIAGSEVDYLAVTTAGILQFDSGYGSNANAYGCRAWANINAGATPSIRASGNVSSVTDAGSGVGDFLVSFTTAMPDANYAAVVTAGGAGTLASANAAVGWAAVYATGSVRVGVSDNNTDTNVDTDYLNVAIFR
jgi:hypothetical protein